MKKKVKTRKKITLQSVIMYILLILTALMFATPMLFTLLSSIKTKVEIFAKPFSWPEVPQWSNYVEAWTMAAYVLSRFDFKCNKFLLLFFMLGMMVPVHTVLVPVSYIIGALNLKNNIPALVMIYVAFSLPFSILVVTNFMKGVNRSLEEAALIDGATYFQIYKNVMLPMTVPAISTISIFNFLGAWNNILFPLLFINDKNLKPIALGLLNFNGERGSDYGPLMAAIVITVAVPLVIYLLFQEKVEGGLAAGAVKE